MARFGLRTRNSISDEKNCIYLIRNELHQFNIYGTTSAKEFSVI